VQDEAPTQVVYRGLVYRVGPQGLVIGRELADGRRVIVVDDQNGGVSRAHCELVLRDGELRLQDLSRYGTFVNEKRISGETTLRRADVIRIGSPGAELQVVSMDSH
jgi:pSer/pThr/pTyr-binding forkhead associated (FHA) protein